MRKNSKTTTLYFWVLRRRFDQVWLKLRSASILCFIPKNMSFCVKRPKKSIWHSNFQLHIDVWDPYKAFHMRISFTTDSLGSLLKLSWILAWYYQQYGYSDVWAPKHTTSFLSRWKSPEKKVFCLSCGSDVCLQMVMRWIHSACLIPRNSRIIKIKSDWANLYWNFLSIGPKNSNLIFFGIVMSWNRWKVRKSKCYSRGNIV